MKKINLLGAVALATVLLTSCLGSGESKQSINGVGVTAYDKSMNLLVYLDDYTGFYVPAIDADPNFMTPGECVQIAGTLYYDSPENANAAAKGYYTVTVPSNGYVKLDKWQMESYLQDTVKPMAGEQLFKSVLAKGAAKIKNHLFITTAYSNYVMKQKNRFYLSYDSSKEPVVVNDKRVYDFYIRMVKEAEGDGATVQNPEDIVIFDGTSIVQRLYNVEKSNGAESLNLRIHYPKEFNKDTTMITSWGAETASFAIEKETTN